MAHSGEKQYRCGHCGQAFLARFDLEKHMIMHFGENPYKCSQCGKAFVNIQCRKTTSIYPIGIVFR